MTSQTLSTASSGRIRVAIDGPIATVVIDNPARRNALNFAMWQQLGDALDRLEADPAVRCIVVRGEGGKAFASGADISEFDAMRSSPEAVATYNLACERAMDRLSEIAKPTIAMIEGFCVGGGMALAVSCDIRIAATDARFSIPAAKLGVGYDYPGISRLVAIVGPSRAKEIFFTARLFEAAEVRDMNLINTLVAPGALAATVAETATLIAGNAPLTIAAIKLAVTTATAEPGQRDLAACHAAELACFQSEDYAEGRKAFAEKRKPVFRGK